MYDLEEGCFRDCFQLVNKLFKSRRGYKFMEINKKYGIYDADSSNLKVGQA